MVVLGIGVGLFYSSVTTAAVTALDPSRAGLAGGIVYMFQIGGGSIGLGLNTAIVVVACSPPGSGTRSASTPRSRCAACSSPPSHRRSVDFERLRDLRHHHRAHA